MWISKGLASGARFREANKNILEDFFDSMQAKPKIREGMLKDFGKLEVEEAT